MGQIGTNIANNEIDIFGELVTITVKSARTYSDWGDETATETDTTEVKAIYNVYSNTNDSRTEGSFRSTNMSFFFRSDQSGLAIGTKVTRVNGEEYSISDIREHGIEGNIHVIEASVEKV